MYCDCSLIYQDIDFYYKISQIIISRNILYNLYHYRIFANKQCVIDIWLEDKIDIDINDYLCYHKYNNEWSWVKSNQVDRNKCKILEFN